MSENPTPEPSPTSEGEGKESEKQEQTFSQADVDRIVRERVKRERDKFADYDELREKASEKATADERIAALEREVEQSKREALKRRVQAAHGIDEEDADLFLTGADEEALTAQAKRLVARESERKQNGNHAPREGTNPQPGNDEMRGFVRDMFSRANSD